MTGETYDLNPRDRNKEYLVAAIATVYTIFLIYVAGLEFLLLGFTIYAPGTILFVLARRELRKRVFSSAELVLFVVAIIGAVLGIVGLATGRISV